MLREHSGLLFHCFVGQFFHCTSHTTVAPHVHSLRTGYMDLLLGRENLSPRKETNIKTRFPKGGQLRYTSLCCCEGCRAFFYHKHISISKTTHGIVVTPKFVLQNCLWWPEHKVAWKETVTSSKKIRSCSQEHICFFFFLAHGQLKVGI